MSIAHRMLRRMFGRPQGILGKLAGIIMAWTNQPCAAWVIDLLGIHRIVSIPLDVFRFHLMAKPGTLVSSSGLVLVVVGWWIMTLARRENALAAPVVKHQKERQDTLIESGVYSVVRHPMSAGAVPLLVGMALWLESYAAALLASVPIGTLVLRILVEKQFLRRALAGYDAYMERVRYRLIPLSW
jgi:protein-S-isoprenylcysteine O-methyltransferase Ste14